MFIIYRWTERQIIAYCWIKSQCYSRQTNMEAGLMVYDWIKETGLANLSRSSLCRGVVFRMEMSRQRKLWWTCSAHAINIIMWTGGKLCHPSEPYPWGKAYFPMDQRLWDLGMATPMLTIHIHLGLPTHCGILFLSWYYFDVHFIQWMLASSKRRVCHFSLLYIVKSTDKSLR